MFKKKVFSILIGIIVTFAAVNAQALTSYESVLSWKDGLTVAASQYQILTFAAPVNVLTSASLNLDIGSVTDFSRPVTDTSGKVIVTLTSPPHGEFFSQTTASYLFCTDLMPGTNLINMNNYLSKLNSGGVISLGIFMDRGSVTFNKAILSGGPVAPEPVSMALVGAGLVALPFARRLRKTIAS